MELIPGLTNDLAWECLIRLPYKSLRSILSVCKAWNSDIRSPDFNRHRKLSGHTRPVFILPQRFPISPFIAQTTKATYSVTVLDPENGSCTKLPPGPELPATAAQWPEVHCRVAGVGSKAVVFITGGFGKATNVMVHVFDFLTGQWRNGAVMPGPGRMFYGLAIDPISGTFLVTGGCDENTTSLRSVFLYDVASDTWKAVDDMENERFYCEEMFHGGNFHVISGFDKSGDGSYAFSVDPEFWQLGEYIEDEFVDLCFDSFPVIMGNGEGDVYRFYNGGKLEVRRGAKWQEVAELLEELRWHFVVKLHVMTWQDKMLVIGFHWKVKRCWAYIRDLKSCEWTKVPLFESFNLNEDPVFGCGMDL